MRKVTIKEIAKKVGVSTTSISFAFNDPSRLAEETVQKILEVAEELGYHPDPVARSMSSGKTGVIGILVPQPITEIIRNPFLAEFIEGVAEVCTKTGFSIMIVPPLKGSIERAIENAAVDGFLVLGLEFYKTTMVVLQKRQVPFVMVDGDPLPGIPAVNIRDEFGAFAVMDFVLNKGHKNISFLVVRSGKEGRYKEYVGTLRRRIRGYIKAMKKHGLSLDDPKISIVEQSSTEEGGINGFYQIWESGIKPTAIVAMSDIMALGAMQAAKEAGLNIPADLSIVGFDDIPAARMMQLTTVSQPLRRKGKLSTDLLVNQINGEQNPVHKMLETKLIIRGSVDVPKP